MMQLDDEALVKHLISDDAPDNAVTMAELIRRWSCAHRLTWREDRIVCTDPLINERLRSDKEFFHKHHTDHVSLWDPLEVILAGQAGIALLICAALKYLRADYDVISFHYLLTTLDPVERFPTVGTSELATIPNYWSASDNYFGHLYDREGKMNGPDFDASINVERFSKLEYQPEPDDVPFLMSSTTLSRPIP